MNEKVTRRGFLEASAITVGTAIGLKVQPTSAEPPAPTPDTRPESERPLYPSSDVISLIPTVILLPNRETWPTEKEYRQRHDTIAYHLASRLEALPPEKELHDLLSGLVELAPARNPELLRREIYNGARPKVMIKGYDAQSSNPYDQTELVYDLRKPISFELHEGDQLIPLEGNYEGSVTPTQNSDGGIVFKIHHSFKDEPLKPDLGINTLEDQLGIQLGDTLARACEIGALTGFDYSLVQQYLPAIESQREAWTSNGVHLSEFSAPYMGQFDREALEYVGRPLLLVKIQ